MKTKKHNVRCFIRYMAVLGCLFLAIAGKEQAYAANADVSDFVTRLYTIILDREPDENGLSDWVERLNNGTFTGVDVSQGFILSDEFLAKDIPNEDFVKIMYRTFFDREADAPGLETWVGFLERGYMKKFIYAGFANSDEFQTICDDYGIIRGTIQLTPEEQAPAVPEGELDVSQFVKRLYSEILGRAADADGLNTWVTLLENGEYSGAEVAEGFIMSEEFINTDMTDEEFVHIMYKTFFDREADEGGLATWMNALEDGYSKRFVFAGFANSTEFGTLCGEYGIEQGWIDTPDETPTPSPTATPEPTPTVTPKPTPGQSDGAVPHAPTEIHNIVGGVQLNWKAQEGVMQYGVWRSAAEENGTYEWLGNTEALEFVDTTVSSGITYYYALTSYDAEQDVHTEMSNSIGIMYLAAPEITEIYNTKDGIAIEWNAVEGATGYAIYMKYIDSKYAEPSTDWMKIVTIEGNETHLWNDKNANTQDEIRAYTICALAGNDKQSSSGYVEAGWKMMRMPSFEVLSIPDIENEKVYCYWMFIVPVHADGFEVRLLVDSVEHKLLYVHNYGLEDKTYHKQEFDADYLETLNGILTVQVRSCKKMDTGEVFYSAWSEEEEIVRTSEMNAIIDKLVLELTASAETDLDKVINIYEWIINNTEYRYSVFGKESDYMENIILHGYAECDGYARCFDVLTKKSGIESNYISAKPVDSFLGHAWNQVKIDGQWYNLDSTWGDIYSIAEDSKLEEYIGIYTQFLLSDDSFNVLEHKEFPYRSEEYECPEDYPIFNYVIQRDGGNNSIFANNKDELHSKIEQKIEEGAELINVWFINTEETTELSEFKSMLNEFADKSDKHIISSNVRYILKGTMGDSDKWLYKAELVIFDLGTEDEKKTSICIPNGISSIAEGAFEGLSELISVELPDSVTSIDKAAFRGCSNLVEINIPDGVKYIEESAFEGCSSLKNITIPDSVEDIYEFSFKDCSALESIIIPKEIRQIWEGTFSGCKSLTEVILPDELRQIDLSAFSDCSSLECIVIPDKVNKIYSSAFNNCTNLKEVIIQSNKLKELTGFFGCSSLESIEIPEGILSIGGSAFESCSSLKTIIIPKSVTSIGREAFENCSSLENIEIPEGVTQISSKAFKNCTSLESINLPIGLEKIDTYAFEDCSNLKSIELPEGLTSIGYYAFNNCTGLVSVQLPDSVTQIGHNAFKNCTGLESIKFPKNLEKIEYNMFEGCSSLKNVELPEGLTSIGKYAFKNCTGLTAIELPAGLTQIENSVFDNCTSLETVKLPDSLEKIGDFVFLKCSNLKSIKLPEGVTSIGNSAFNATGLVSIELPEGLTNLGYSAFSNCTNLESIKLPDSLKKIENSTFSDCSSLTSIELPDGITSIGKDAFFKCTSLTCVTLSDGITSIGETPFRYCSSLTSILVSHGTYAETWVKENYPEKIQYK